jgi:hypothetical protein
VKDLYGKGPLLLMHLMQSNAEFMYRTSMHLMQQRTFTAQHSSEVIPKTSELTVKDLYMHLMGVLG